MDENDTELEVKREPETEMSEICEDDNDWPKMEAPELVGANEMKEYDNDQYQKGITDAV